MKSPTEDSARLRALGITEPDSPAWRIAALCGKEGRRFEGSLACVLSVARRLGGPCGRQTVYVDEASPSGFVEAARAACVLMEREVLEQPDAADAILSFISPTESADGVAERAAGWTKPRRRPKVIAVLAGDAEIIPLPSDDESQRLLGLASMRIGMELSKMMRPAGYAAGLSVAVEFSRTRDLAGAYSPLPNPDQFNSITGGEDVFIDAERWTFYVADAEASSAANDGVDSVGTGPTTDTAVAAAGAAAGDAAAAAAGAAAGAAAAGAAASSDASAGIAESKEDAAPAGLGSSSPPPPLAGGVPTWDCSECGARSLRPLLKCARCKVTRYCDRDCQRRHWKMGHKFVCCSSSSQEGKAAIRASVNN